MIAQVPQTGNRGISQYDTKGTHPWQSAANHCKTPAAEWGQLGATWSSLKLLCIRSLDKSVRSNTTANSWCRSWGKCLEAERPTAVSRYAYLTNINTHWCNPSKKEEINFLSLQLIPSSSNQCNSLQDGGKLQALQTRIVWARSLFNHLSKFLDRQ